MHEPAGVPAVACQSLLQGRARSAAYARISVPVAATSFFPHRSRLDARWQEAWHRHDNKSCERCSSRASSPHLFSRSDDAAVAFFFSVVRQWLQRQQWPVLPAVARSKRALSMPACPPAKVMELTCRLPTCRVQRSSYLATPTPTPIAILSRVLSSLYQCSRPH